MAYAATTDVPFERSVAEIVGLVKAAGATKIGQLEDADEFRIQFVMADRMVRFTVRFPSDAEVGKMTGPRSDPARVGAQWRRQRGRALLLVIKAKLESVASNVETFEQAFLANVVMPDGYTLYDRIREPIAVEYRSGKPQLLLGGPR